MFVIVINCLRLSVVVIYCCHGDGSHGRHMCTKYHGHTYYYQQLRGCYVGEVSGEHIAMAMVVVGHICTQTIMVVHNTIYNVIG